MKNNVYVDSDQLSKEMSYFNSEWIFVCLKSSLRDNNAFVTLKTYYNNIVVQNFRGKLVALSNICVHRFNTIQNGIEGKSALVCDYHSWGYDKSGKTRSDKSACLESYEIGECGDFVFINIGKNSTKLTDYLGNFYQELLELSSLFSESNLSAIKTVKHNANWKFLVENVLECYHCHSVHSVSLGDIGLGLGEPYNHLTYNGHDSIEYPVIRANKKKKTKGLELFENRDLKHSSYRHFYLAPNLFVSSTEGLSFYIGRLDPISETETNLQVMFRISKLNNEVNKNIIKHFYEVSLNNTLNVIKEDQFILENQQRNMKYVPNSTAIFTKQEPRIINFHREYINLINT